VAVRLRATSLAVDTLRRLTAFRVGGCPITVRPLGSQNSCFVPTYAVPGGFTPGININGNWVNNCGHAGTRYSTAEVPLPAPVGRIDEVKVDGVVVDPENYRVDNGYILTWQGTGDAPWPQTQDVTRPDTEVGTFSVTYLNGHVPDEHAAYAAGILAKEFAKACTGGKCRLPSGVQSIVRQGITMEIASGAFPGGLTGIREADAFIALWNPQRHIMQTRIWSPDVQTPRVTGPTASAMQFLDGGSASVEVDEPVIEGGTP
jgi:hypothetical protein